MAPGADWDAYAAAHPQVDEEAVPELAERWIRRVRPAVLLDAGCGEGSLVRALVRRGLVPERIVACDASELRVGRLQGFDDRVTWFVDDVQDLAKVETASVDFALSSQVIEHVDDARMLKALARVTKPGGHVFLSTVLKRWYGWYPYRNAEGRWVLDPTHVREYASEADLLGRIDPGDFAVCETAVHPVAYPVVDVALRGLARLGGRAAPGASGMMRLLRRHARVRVPGYAVIEVVLARAQLRD